MFVNSEQALPSWHFWIDRGGTFTDIVAWHEASSELLTAKVRSEDPGRREDASLAAIRAVLGLDDSADLRSLGAVSIRMGTTVATNALLTRSGVRTAVVLTKGLGDLLILGDQSRPRLFELDISRPPPTWRLYVVGCANSSFVPFKAVMSEPSVLPSGPYPPA